MARDFSKNTANFISLGANVVNPLVSGASQITVAAWINADTFDTAAGDNNIFQSKIDATGNAAIRLNIDSSPAKVLMGGRSQAADAIKSFRGSVTITTGSWFHIMGVNDFANQKIYVYVNGAADGNGAATFGASTFTPGTPVAADQIGSQASGATNLFFDGRIAELGIWTSDIGLAGAASLAAGVSPLMVHSDTLQIYFPLLGRNSPEKDIVGSLSGTINGSVPNADHLRMYYPSKNITARKNFPLDGWQQFPMALPERESITVVAY